MEPKEELNKLLGEKFIKLIRDEYELTGVPTLKERFEQELENFKSHKEDVESVKSFLGIGFMMGMKVLVDILGEIENLPAKKGQGLSHLCKMDYAHMVLGNDFPCKKE